MSSFFCCQIKVLCNKNVATWTFRVRWRLCLNLLEIAFWRVVTLSDDSFRRYTKSSFRKKQAAKKIDPKWSPWHWAKFRTFVNFTSLMVSLIYYIPGTVDFFSEFRNWAVISFETLSSQKMIKFGLKLVPKNSRESYIIQLLIMTYSTDNFKTLAE